MTATRTAYEGLQDRIADMDALLALAGAQDTDDLTAGQAERLNGLGLSDYTDTYLSDVAYSLADGYCYGARIYYMKAERADARMDFIPARIELLLAGGGPTHVLTWDERGQGWSDYFDSWAAAPSENYTGDPTHVQLSEEEWETVRSFLAAFITGDELE